MELFFLVCKERLVKGLLHLDGMFEHLTYSVEEDPLNDSVRFFFPLIKRLLLKFCSHS